MTPKPVPPTKKTRLRRLLEDLRDAGPWRTAARTRCLRVAVVTMGSSSTCLESFAPLFRHRRRFRDEGRVVFRSAWVDHEAVRLPRWVGAADVVLLQSNHFVPTSQGLRLVDAARRACPAAPILYYDGDDDAGVAWPEVVAGCDLVVKNHLYRDRDWYRREFVGKSNLTDHVARVHGVDFADDPYPRSRPLAPATIDRLWLGWNLACSETARRFAGTPAPLAARPAELTLRATIPPSWLAPLRRPAVDALRALAGRRRVVFGEQRVDHAAYCAELLASRACLSPFGHGEVCFRDFEAVLAGCLLVKPDMSHLETKPDVYRDGVTCAEVRWDWSDLEQVVGPLLDDLDRAARIVAAARAALEPFLRGDAVLDDFRAQLRRVGAPTTG